MNLNYSISSFIISRYLPEEAIEYAEQALKDGAVPGRIRKHIEDGSGIHVTAKFMQNLRQRAYGIYANYLVLSSRIRQ